MRHVIIALSLVGSLVACGGEPAKAPEAPPTPVVEAPKPVEAPAAPAAPVAFDAKATFGTVCGTCHGLEGKGDGVAAAGLNPKPAAFGDPEFWKTRDEAHIKKVIKEGGASVGKSPMMAPFGAQFNDEQIAALAAHIMSFKPQ